MFGKRKTERQEEVDRIRKLLDTNPAAGSEMMNQLTGMIASIYCYGAHQHGSMELMKLDGLFDEDERPTQKLMDEAWKVTILALLRLELEMRSKVGNDDRKDLGASKLW